ncbi:hypothetical protein [Heliophilum fasciatum]|uniref:Uncharacterized protein n=1 Tax=Heliophilum fasciatum TaxID=35700 RepID=A0A4R2RE25_9FIRM|nr:hypothetical protein [Heliophilum fasciatum]MCW2279023.1 hypothetical protein [Heliophilum fasciatum]TCP61740.1 hypothetical protein EDD73_12611 [Heliophilum fasciatum]
MTTTYFRVMHTTGTYADALEAMGLAFFLDLLMPGRVQRVRDLGAYYQIELDGQLDPADWQIDDTQHQPGYPYFAAKKFSAIPEHYAYYDYEAEKQRNDSYWSRIKSLKNQKLLTDEMRQSLQADEPNPRHDLMKNMYVLQAFGSHNALLERISQEEPERFRAAIIEKLRAYAMISFTPVQTPSVDCVEIVDGKKEKKKKTVGKDKCFAPTLSAVQVFNPIVGKGVNRTKPTGTGLAGLPSTYVDWFSEYMRYIAIHKVANAYSVGDDIKFVVLLPADMPFYKLHQLGTDLVNIRIFKRTSCQIDIQASLGLAKRLLEHSRQKQEEVEEDLWLNTTPKEILDGLAVGYFKSLGTGKALTNIATIGLPGWFPIQTLEDVNDWLDILDEHQQITERLNEDHSEEADLLYRYRDFLSSGRLNDLLDFATGYGVFVFRQAARSDRLLRRLSENNLERLVTALNSRYSTIVHNEGFRAIADAIRRATVAEQYRRAKGQQVYEVRYGLLADLKRKAKSKKEFILLLGDFISSYNYENARRAELKKDSNDDWLRRPNIAESHIVDIIALIDEFGVEAVAMLLAAFGAAKRDEPQEKEDKKP